MPTINDRNLSLLDHAKRLDPDGKVATVAELLNQINGILDDAVFREGNLPTGHRVTVRTGLPGVFWRLLNQGVPGSKSTTAQIDESIGMLEAFSEVDVDLAELNGNAGSFRMSEDMAFIESMNQGMATTMFYGNTAVNPERFIGLAPRYSAISGAGNAQNVLSAGGTGSTNTSIWLVGWGDNSVFGVYPKGSKAGLVQEDLGIETVVDTSNNGRFRAYRSRYQWKAGLVVKDWRYIVRIANVLVGDLTGQTGTQASTAATSIIRLMSRAIDRLPSLRSVRPVFYVNRTVASMLRVHALAFSQNAVTVQESINQFGATIFDLKFMGIPVRIVDQILNTEAQIS